LNVRRNTVGQGVETPAQRDRLRELGCDQAQGYRFGRPVPGSRAAAALHDPTG
jgi:EAL domain-containing protein (putative c-di-GMP-specific phosphodiesterase class I)